MTRFRSFTQTECPTLKTELHHTTGTVPDGIWYAIDEQWYRLAHKMNFDDSVVYDPDTGEIEVFEETKLFEVTHGDVSGQNKICILDSIDTVNEFTDKYGEDLESNGEYIGVLIKWKDVTKDHSGFELDLTDTQFDELWKQEFHKNNKAPVHWALSLRVSCGVIWNTDLINVSKIA